MLLFPIIVEHPNNVSLEYLSRTDNFIKEMSVIMLQIAVHEIHPPQKKMVVPRKNLFAHCLMKDLILCKMTEKKSSS
jgi:hypothetical protein